MHDINIEKLKQNNIFSQAFENLEQDLVQNEDQKNLQLGINILKDTVHKILGRGYAEKEYSFNSKKNQSQKTKLMFNEQKIVIDLQSANQKKAYVCDLKQGSFYLNQEKKGLEIIPEIIEVIQELIELTKAHQQKVSLKTKIKR